MKELEQMLEPVLGCLELGLVEDAWEYLEDLPPDLRVFDEVLALRIEIFQRLGKWESARMLAESLARDAPDNPDWWLSWAYAQRRETSVADAQDVLRIAATFHKDVALIPYNFACYACVLGNFVEAGDWLEIAIHMDANCERLALDDPDLEPFWPELRKSPTSPTP